MSSNKKKKIMLKDEICFQSEAVTAISQWVQCSQNVHCVTANFPLVLDVLNMEIFYRLSLMFTLFNRQLIFSLCMKFENVAIHIVSYWALILYM